MVADDIYYCDQNSRFTRMIIVIHLYNDNQRHIRHDDRMHKPYLDNVLERVRIHDSGNDYEGGLENRNLSQWRGAENDKIWF